MKIFRVASTAIAFSLLAQSAYASDAFSLCNASVKKIQFLMDSLDKTELYRYKELLETSTTIQEVSVLLQLDQNALEELTPSIMKEKNTTEQEAKERLVWGLKYLELKNVDNAINFYDQKGKAGFWQQFLTTCIQANSSQ